MITSSQVRAAWDAAIWTDSSITAITPNIFPYEIDLDSDYEASQLYHRQKVNYFTYEVFRSSTPKLCGTILYRFEVQVRYFLQQENDATARFNTVSDTLDTLDALVLSALTVNWSDTVDYYTGSENLGIESATVDGLQCWRGGLVFRAEKTV